MKTADVAADAGRVAVLRPFLVLLVSRYIQGLRDQSTLQGNVLGSSRTERLVLSPANRAMVDDAVVAACHPHAVQGDACRIARSNPQESQDAIMRPKQPQIVVGDANPFAGSGLTCKSQIRDLE